MGAELARVAGAHTGAFSQERVFIHRLSQGTVELTKRRAPSRTKNLKRRFFFRRILPFALLFISLLFQLFVRIQIIQTGYRVHNERARALELDRELRELRSQLAFATSPKQLLARAEKELGLTVTPPQRLKTVVIREPF